VRAESGEGLAADVTRVRRGLAAAAPRSTRIRAWFLPASTLSTAQEGLQRLGDMMSWLDTSLPALGRQAYPRHD
jgi:hypothetical protein